MKKIDLECVLNGDIKRIQHLDLNESTDPNIRVTVLPINVRSVILSFLNGNISSDELSLWAHFLCIRSGEYVCKDTKSDELEDYYEDMWYVVQKLSTPEIDGEITPETVRVYLKELDKYFKNDSNAANDSE